MRARDLPMSQAPTPSIAPKPASTFGGAAWYGLEIRPSSVKGRGLFATRRIPAGTVVTKVVGEVQNYDYDEESDYGPTWYAVARGEWIEPFEDSPARFVNHSCEPNAFMADTTTIKAARDIRPGEEILIDYATTEEDPKWLLECRCGTPRCRRVIRAALSFSS